MRQRIVLIALFVLCLVGLAHAQAATSETDSPLVLSTIGGIVIASIMLTRIEVRAITEVSMLDRPKWAVDTGWLLSKLPMWVYVNVNALVLTYLANKVLHTLDGDLLTLMWASIQNGATASGFHGWFSNASKPVSASGQARNLTDR